MRFYFSALQLDTYYVFNNFTQMKKRGEKNADWNRFSILFILYFFLLFAFSTSFVSLLSSGIFGIMYFRFVKKFISTFVPPFSAQTSLLSQNSLHACLPNSHKLKDCRQFFFLRSYWWNSSYKGNYFPIRNRLCLLDCSETTILFRYRRQSCRYPEQFTPN